MAERENVMEDNDRDIEWECMTNDATTRCKLPQDCSVDEQGNYSVEDIAEWKVITWNGYDNDEDISKAAEDIAKRDSYTYSEREYLMTEVRIGLFAKNGKGPRLDKQRISLSD